MRFLFISFLFLSASVSALDVQTSGFGSFIVTASNSDTLGYRNDLSIEDGLFDDKFSIKPHSNLGFQVNTTFNENWDVVAQWILMEQSQDEIKDYTRLAFARYIHSDSLSFRVGRTAFNLFELSEFRDIGIAYPWTKAPTEVYGLVPSRYLDGIDVTFNFKIANWPMSIKSSFGETEIKLSDDEPIKLKSAKGVEIGGNFDGLTITFRHTEADVTTNNQSIQVVVDGLTLLSPFWPDAFELAQQNDFRQHDIRYSSLFFGYDWTSWTLKAEVAEVDSSSSIVDDLINGYVHIGYQTAEHAFYWIGSFVDSDRYRFDGLVPPDPSAQEAMLFVNELNTFYRPNQITHSIGWRWNLKENLAFKLQVQNSKVAEAGNGLWTAPDVLRQFLPAQSINSISSGLSFSF